MQTEEAWRRGRLRIYLGAAPGVGKTFAMLNEGRRGFERGRDVVVGYVETHGRPRTAEQIDGLEVIQRRPVEYRGATLEEMDVDAILARKPAQALVDELAHTNAPGSRNPKRWQDVEELLAAGIDVISTLNIQHLESLNDVVERITGAKQRETIPDAVVRQADAIELVDMSPEALRRRMAHGNIYKPERIDASLTNYFRPGNLAALRELALLWVADRVDEALGEYRERHGITEPWETRERVLVAITGAPGTEALIRRAARMAQRAHGELFGLHVSTAEGVAGPRSENLVRHQQLLADLGGEYHEVVASDVAAALADFARAENCTQLVLGASRRSRLSELVRGSVINRAVRLAVPIDVHVISHDPSEAEQPLPVAAAARSVGHRRSPAAAKLPRGCSRRSGSRSSPLLLIPARDDIGLETVLLLFLSLVVAVGAIGGIIPGVAAAVVALPARQLLLHATDPSLDGRGGRERARARHLRRGERRRQRTRRPRGPPNPRSAPGPSRSGDVGPARRLRRRRGSAPSPRRLATVGVPAGRGRGAVPCRRPLGGRSLGRCTHSGQPRRCGRSRRDRRRSRPRPRRPAPQRRRSSGAQRVLRAADLGTRTRPPRRAGGDRDGARPSERVARGAAASRVA